MKMTDDRPYILLVRAWAERLERALESADRMLPDSVDRAIDKVYTGDAGAFYLFDRNPDHWEEQPTKAIALLPLYAFLDELREAEKILKGDDDDRR